MDRALVVVKSTNGNRELLREAGELAGSVDAELVLLSLTAKDEYERDLETLEMIADEEQTTYSANAVLDHAESFAEERAQSELEDIEVRYQSVGAVVDSNGKASKIVEIAESRDCDHIFISGRHRSPTGKAVFGDTAQSVVLNFDGTVTIRTE